jgi:uncharacterized protein (TIGR04255 family)
MYPNREVFEATPLVLVAAEIRFTDSPRLRQQATLDKISIALEDRFPAPRPIPEMGFQISVGTAPQPMPPSTLVRLTNAANTESISLTSTSLLYETTHYTEFSELLAVVQRAGSALVEAGVLPVVERVGLRYIDEVRVPDLITDARQWSQWIDHRLIDHLAVGPADRPVTTTQGVTNYDLGNEKGLNFRYAAFPDGSVVDPNLLSRRREAASGPFFVLDFDGYQNIPQSTTRLDTGVIGKSLEAVHDPAGEIFQRSITDKARELFRGNPA